MQELEKLKCEIAKAASSEPYMKEEHPLRWLKFHRAILQEAKKGTPYMPLAKVKINSFCNENSLEQ